MKLGNLGLLLLVLCACPVGTAGALPLDLEDFIRRVHASSRELHLARLETTAAAAERMAARAQALPRVDFAAGYGRTLSESTDNPYAPTYDNSYQLALTVSQALLDARVFYGLKASALLQEAASAQAEAVRQLVANEARKAFYAAILARSRRALSRDSEANALASLENVRLRRASGAASDLEVLQAEAAYQATVAPRIRAERDYDLALNQLKLLAGLDLEEPLELVGSLEEAARRTSRTAQASDNHPELMAAAYELQTRELGVRAARAQRLPTLAGSLRYTVQAASDRLDWDNDSASLALGLSLALPVASGGAVEAAIRKANAEREKAAVREAGIRDRIRVEAHNASVRIEEAEQALEAASRAAAVARRAYEVIQSRADAGLATQLELRISRTNYEEAELGYQAAAYELLAARFDQELAVGRVP